MTLAAFRRQPVRSAICDPRAAPDFVRFVAPCQATPVRPPRLAAIGYKGGGMRAMAQDQATTTPAKRARIAAIDAARGVALGGMVVYHLIWDFAHFGLIAPTLPFAPATRALSHVVAGAFLALVGVSLALAHPHGLRREAFLRRLALIAGAAALVTAASYAVDAQEPILFGILHCIFVSSLIAALFVAAPPRNSIDSSARRRSRRRSFIPARRSTRRGWSGSGSEPWHPARSTGGRCCRGRASC